MLIRRRGLTTVELGAGNVFLLLIEITTQNQIVIFL